MSKHIGFQTTTFFFYFWNLIMSMRGCEHSSPTHLLFKHSVCGGKDNQRKEGGRLTFKTKELKLLTL